ncbi:MAG TPA: beta-ketoacyl synthase N-terminal-like domain-containing protein [Ktedonobacteraceae bacterium]|jgi:acyl transferase domain-containing protein/acyl carrier protein
MDKSREEIEAWLLDRVSGLLGIKARRLDVEQPLARYNLDSLIAIELTDDLERWLGRKVPETLFWDEPGIRDIARFLCGEKATDESGQEDADEFDSAPPEISASPGEQRARPQPPTVEPIAIIGLSCRVPGAADATGFWRLLCAGVDALCEVPSERWDPAALYDPDPAAPGKMTSRRGGFLADIDRFDPEFFGISPREAFHLDPQQRLLLEVSWEALEHAGLAPRRLAASQTGVFIGISTNDYLKTYRPSLAALDAYTNIGNAHSLAASRISYLLDLRGPSMALDTACSSSLVALHLACQSLRSGESALALAGGVNVILAPDVSVSFSKARMLATQDRCRPFDARADGFLRAEGCGMLVLKRLRDAEADGDRILALIRGSALNQNGHGSGLVAPSSQAEQAVIRQALMQAGVDAEQVEYIVAQGTGTPLGDVAELQALSAVLGAGERPCAITSVKANIGHLEAAAGVVNVIAATLALGHHEIPGQLHFQQPHPQASLAHTRLSIPVSTQPWPRTGQAPRLAGVNAFSINGTNAHVVLEEAPVRPASQSDEALHSPHLLVLSARNRQALAALVARYRTHLNGCSDTLADLCFTASVGRAHFASRLAIVAETHEQIGNALAMFPAASRETGLFCEHVESHAQVQVALLLGGEGPIPARPGYQLYRRQPVFRQALERCAHLLAPELEQPLLSVLYPSSADATVLHTSSYAQPALFSLEYALAMLLQSWGITPGAVLGHGVGACVAACLTGALTLEDALLLAAEYGRMLEHPASAEETLAPLAKLLPAGPLTLPFVSPLTGRCHQPGECLPATFWERHLHIAAQLTASLPILAGQGVHLGIAVDAVASLARTERQDEETIWLSCLCAPEAEMWRQLLLALGSLYVHGQDIDWTRIYQGSTRQIVSLPAYPFQRERYWHTPPASAHPHPLLKKRTVLEV